MVKRIKLQEGSEPDSTFSQGLRLGIIVAGVPFVLVIVWYMGVPWINELIEVHARPPAESLTVPNGQD